MFKVLGIDELSIHFKVQPQALCKKHVCEGMQAARSLATQAIKKQFIGK
jgi:hypothetical protein